MVEYEKLVDHRRVGEEIKIRNKNGETESIKTLETMQGNELERHYPAQAANGGVSVMTEDPIVSDSGVNYCFNYDNSVELSYNNIRVTVDRGIALKLKFLNLEELGKSCGYITLKFKWQEGSIRLVEFLTGIKGAKIEHLDRDKTNYQYNNISIKIESATLKW